MPRDLRIPCDDYPSTDYIDVSEDNGETVHVLIRQEVMPNENETCMQLHRNGARRLRDWLNQWLEETR